MWACATRRGNIMEDISLTAENSAEEVVLSAETETTGMASETAPVTVESSDSQENSTTESSQDEKPEQQDTDVTDESSETEDGEDGISFADLGLDEMTLEAIRRKGFVTPSPIQVLAIPRLLNGDANVIARARTGTGKTAAFGLPIVQQLRSGSDHVQAIILEPTRELAMQTCTEMASFTPGKYPRTAVVYGGASMGEQIRALRKGVEIVVGTPGRVQDLMDRGVLQIDRIQYFILDEGDEMLDMGFVDDIENIFAEANPECRVLLFSATVPKPILKIAEKFMGDYEIVEEEGHDEEPLLIDQRYWVLRESEKIEALVRLIDIAPDFYGLVFVQRKSDADMVCKTLDEKGYEVAALHGDIPQGQREKILARFRIKKTRILVATDVAARGIDISGLTHVVNYDLPFDGPTYVHRIGRTGRAGAAGMAVTFVRPEESRRKIQYLKAAVKKSAKGEMLEGRIPSVEEVVEAKRKRLFNEVREKLGLNIRMDENGKIVGQNPGELSGDTPEAEASGNATPENTLRKGDPIFDKMAEELCAGQDPQEVLASLLSATYGSALSAKRYGKIASAAPQDKGRKGERGDRAGNPGQTRLFVQLGWIDGYNPKKVANYIADLTGIKNSDVDDIDMADKFCLMSIPTEAARKAIELSSSDSMIPHIHEDVKAGRSSSRGGRGRDRGGFGRDRDRGFGRDRGGFGRDRGGFGRDRDRGFGRDRGGFGRDRDRDRGFGHSNARAGVHTATQRSGSSSYFKSSKADEY